MIITPWCFPASLPCGGASTEGKEEEIVFNGSRIRALAVLLGMILAVQVALVIVAVPAQAASGSLALTAPTSFSFNTTAGSGSIATTAVVGGGTFGSGATIQFVISTSTRFTKPLAGKLIGSLTLPAGQTTISPATKVDLFKGTLNGGSVVTAAGSYFISATDDGGSTFAGAVSVDIIAARISVLPSPAQLTPFPGNAVSFKGQGYTAGKSVDIFLGAPAAPPGTLLRTVTAKPDGTVSGSFSLPEVASGPAPIYALDRDSGLSNGVGFALSIVPGIRLEFPAPAIIDPTGGPITVGGFGFASGATIAKNDISVNNLAWGPSSATAASSAGSFHVPLTPPTSLVTSPLSQGFQTVMEKSTGVTTKKLLASSPGFTAAAVALVPDSAFAVNVGDSVDIAVFSYPANTGLSLMMGGRLIQSVLTDNHGAAIQTVAIPDLPGSATGRGYTVDAVNAQGLSASTKLTGPTALVVQSSLAVTDLAGAATPLVRPKGQILVSGTGFAARDSLTIQASGSMIVTSTIGTATSDSLGRFSVSVAVKQSSLLPFHTGTAVTVSAASVPGGPSGTVLLDEAFTEWASPTVIDRSLLGGVASVGENVTFAGTDFAPGRTYEVLFNDQPLSPDVVFTATSTGAVPTLPTPLKLVVPNLAQGVYTVKAVPVGLTTADATELFVISKANSVPTLLARIKQNMPSTSLSGVAGDKMDLFLFGWKSGEGLNVFRVGQSGAFASASALQSGGRQFRDLSVPHLPGGAYLLYAQGTSATGTRTADSKPLLSIGVNLNLPDSGVANGMESFDASGLAANAAYDVLFAGGRVFTGIASDAGDLHGQFAVPVILTGAYDVKLAAAADGAVAVSASFQIDQAFTLTPSPEAIVGQSVQFSWDTGLNASNIQNLVPPIFLSVLIDGASYVTLPVAKTNFVPDPDTLTGVLSGAFSMPNAAPETVRSVTLEFFDSNSASHTQQFGSSGTSTVMTQSGAGALISGIDFAQEFASVEGKLGEIKVSISDLNPQLQSINGNVARIQTNLGLMSANVTAINAKVTTISQGVATIQTDVGIVKASVSDINAKVTSIQNGMVRITSAVGNVTVAINAIEPAITRIDAGVVTLQTDLGEVKTNVDAIRPVVTTMQGDLVTVRTDVGTIRGTVSTIDGNVVTIKTDVGNLQVMVSDLPQPTSINNVLYVAIAAAVLSLIGAVGAIASAAMIMRRLAK